MDEMKLVERRQPVYGNLDVIKTLERRVSVSKLRSKNNSFSFVFYLFMFTSSFFYSQFYSQFLKKILLKKWRYLCQQEENRS